jgi:exopolysaccharide biosynthesis protein
MRKFPANRIRNPEFYDWRKNRFCDLLSLTVLIFINLNPTIMKKTFRFISFYLCLFFLCLSLPAQEFTKIAEGVEHARIIRQVKSAEGKEQKATVNLLRLDLTKVRLDVIHALDAAIGLEKTSSIAARYGAVAAINGGFFRIDKSIFEGDNTGTLVIDKRLWSESYSGRIALMISNTPNVTQAKFGHLNLSYSITAQKNTLLDFSGVNRQRANDELIIYTPEFHRTTLTGINGVEAVVKKGKVTQILQAGNTLIPDDGFVLSATGKMSERLLKAIRIGTKIKLSYDTPIDLTDAESIEDAVSGVPQLIKNGKIEITWEKEKIGKSFVETKHPRTAVANLKDGKFLMAAVDGRTEESAGMNLQELAEFLLELGATDAMNLDGGGSTTMVIDGKVINKPSDKEGERKIGDAILVRLRK